MRGSALRVPANLQHVPASRTVNATDSGLIRATAEPDDAVSDGDGQRNA